MYYKQLAKPQTSNSFSGNHGNCGESKNRQWTFKKMDLMLQVSEG